MQRDLEYIIVPVEKKHEECINILARNIQVALAKKFSIFNLREKNGLIKIKAPPEALCILKNIFGIKYIISKSAIKVKGPGGLPIGVSGKAISLFSGGFDSPVASWMMLRRGFKLDFIHFNLVGGDQVYWAVRVLKFLVENWCHGYEPRLFLVDLKPIVARLLLHIKESLRQVILRRIMYRISEEIAMNEGVKALVTGESLGQVSSQTLTNMKVAERDIKVLILRPLLGFDKVEIMDKARAIGTYSLSESVKECCVLARGPVATRASIGTVLYEERKIPNELIEEAIKEASVFKISRIQPHDFLPTNMLTLDFIPEGAIIVDVRPLEDYKRWHPSKAIHISDLDIGSIKKNTILLLYCESGEVSRVLAEELRKAGVRAYSFRGGIERLKRLK